jgi:hypothetical protein
MFKLNRVKGLGIGPWAQSPITGNCYAHLEVSLLITLNCILF